VGGEYEIGPVDAGEVTALLHASEGAFLEDVHDEDVALWSRLLEPDRTLVARSGGAIVATSGLFSMRLAVPGGVAAMAGVTAVGVDPVHRRRGLLDRLMRRHLAAIHERGDEALSALWASEAGIYGRWGYGQATRNADLRIRSADARLLAGPAPGRPRAGSPAELLPDMRAAYADVQPSYPGLIARGDLMWEELIADFEHRRDGFGQLRALATDGGYALYAVRKKDVDGRPEDEIRLRELIAATPEARAVLWDHLLGLSLTRSVHWPLAPEDEPLAHMLGDSRAARAYLDDALYVRLVDLPRALAQRSYSAPVDVVLDVTDDVCPWNAGRWRLAADAGGATCEPTDAAADLALSATELGAAYLGGTPLALLGAAGRVQERTSGALAAAGTAFKGVREPWCAAIF
jgi:predicted acetyltransferase